MPQRIYVTVVVVAAVLLMGIGSAVAEDAAPDPVPTPEQVRARARTSAWIVTWDRTKVLASLRRNAGSIGSISPYWFQLKYDGSAVVNRKGAFDKDVLAVAREREMSVVPTISNDFDPRRVTRMLGTPALRAKHVRQLVALANRPAFTGIELDYENVDPASRAAFTKFVQDLASALRVKKKTLTVVVQASTAADADSDVVRATDYTAIGRAVYQVRLMAYDQAGPCGAAGPVAPIDWVEDVIRHVITKVPRSKLVLGAPLYGYDWSAGAGCAASRTWSDVGKLRTKWNGTVGWSALWKTRALRYTAAGTRHVLWFEDAASTTAKAALVNEHDLRGIALWRLGGEDQATWPGLVPDLGEAR